MLVPDGNFHWPALGWPVLMLIPLRSNGEAFGLKSSNQSGNRPAESLTEDSLRAMTSLMTGPAYATEKLAAPGLGENGKLTIVLVPSGKRPCETPSTCGPYST